MQKSLYRNQAVMGREHEKQRENITLFLAEMK